LKDLAPERIAAQVRETVARVLKKNPADIALDTNLFEELGADSLTGVEILAVLDKKLGLDLPEEKLEDVTTFGQLVDLVTEELKSQSRA
jgi:acyl carrier protein